MIEPQLYDALMKLYMERAPEVEQKTLSNPSPSPVPQSTQEGSGCTTTDSTEPSLKDASSQCDRNYIQPSPEEWKSFDDFVSRQKDRKQKRAKKVVKKIRKVRSKKK